MRTKLLIGIPTAILALFTLACSGGGSESTKGPGVEDSGSRSAHGSSASTEAGRQITFEVTGSGVSTAGSITYDLGANQSQDNGAKLPWSKKTRSTEDFLVLSLVAQSGGDSGSITCRISVDGKVVVENTSRGAYAVVTCTKDL